MLDEEQQKLLSELKEFKQEHQKLDIMLDSPQVATHYDQLTLQRLKKRKLWLKDAILNIEETLYPDIIA